MRDKCMCASHRAISESNSVNVKAKARPKGQLYQYGESIPHHSKMDGRK